MKADKPSAPWSWKRPFSQINPCTDCLDDTFRHPVLLELIRRDPHAHELIRCDEANILLLNRHFGEQEAHQRDEAQEHRARLHDRTDSGRWMTGVRNFARHAAALTSSIAGILGETS